MHPLRRFIHKKGLSIQEFVDQYKIGLSRTYIVMICCGSANFAKGTAEKVSKATGIPAEILMFPELDPGYVQYKKEQKKARDAKDCNSLKKQQVTHKK